MNPDIISAIGSFGSAVIFAFSLILVWKQLKEQLKRSDNDAYYSAVNLMVANWGKMNEIMYKFPPEAQWESADRQKADDVCMIFHQLGHLVKRGSVPEEICDVYFYAIPRIHEILGGHIAQRRRERAPDYYNGFTYLVGVAQRRNEAAKRALKGTDDTFN